MLGAGTQEPRQGSFRVLRAPTRAVPFSFPLWEDKDEGEAGRRRPKHIWVLPSGGSEVAGTGSPTTGAHSRHIPGSPLSDTA